VANEIFLSVPVHRSWVSSYGSVVDYDWSVIRRLEHLHLHPQFHRWQTRAAGQLQGQSSSCRKPASQCGYTPQYSALEATYEKYKDQGFVILGFPANNFGAQEPGTNDEIKTFCTLKYSVTFPMYAKISVKGADQASLFA
jgi:glutathione peroxidase-family protein